MPKILWMSPYSLHDTSSGAAVNCRIMLKSLQRRGFEVWTCSSFIFNARSGSQQAFGDLTQMFAKDQNSVFVFDEDQIHYVYTRAADTDALKMTMAESQLFFKTFCTVLEEFKPDIVIGNGITPLALSCFAEAKHQGISTVYMLAHGNHQQFNFPNIDLIVTDSEATTRLYASTGELNLIPIGGFFDLKSIVAPEHKKLYVTMINPSEHKGVAIFAKLAKVCQTELPDLKFLTVNTQQKFTDVVNRLHEKGDINHHPYKSTDFPNVFMSEPLMDMRPIYAITSVLIVPSLWFEAWGRVASEAIFNNIPVIAANNGGLAEATAGGSILLDTPKHCQDDYTSLPDDNEIKPWLDALKYLLNHNVDKELETCRKRLSQENASGRLIAALTPLIARTHQLRDQQEESRIDINSLTAQQLDQLEDIKL